MGTMDCPECAHLWRLYAEATSRHVSLIADQAEAAKHKKVERFRQLEQEILRAGMARTQAKSNIEAHESEAHPNHSSTGAGGNWPRGV